MTAGENMRGILEKSGAYRFTEDAPLEWELAAYAAGFALIEEGIKEAWQGVFAATAPEARLWELESRSLPHPPGCPVAARREIQKERLRARPDPLSLGDMPSLLLAAGIRGTAEEVDGTVRVTVTEYLLPKAQADKELALLMPLHVKWEIAEG